MSIVHKCDRCGNVFSTINHGIYKDQTFNRIELCDDCFRDFNDWLRDRNKGQKNEENE